MAGELSEGFELELAEGLVRLREVDEDFLVLNRGFHGS